MAIFSVNTFNTNRYTDTNSDIDPDRNSPAGSKSSSLPRSSHPKLKVPVHTPYAHVFVKSNVKP